jgi:hypothetical protein
MTLPNMAAATYTFSVSVANGGVGNAPRNMPTFSALLESDGAAAVDTVYTPGAAGSFGAGSCMSVITIPEDGASLKVTFKITGAQVINLWGGGITAISLVRA